VLEDSRGRRRVALKAPTSWGTDWSERARVGRRSSTLPAPEGAYAALPAWSSRQQYLTAVAAACNSTEGRELRKAWTRKWVADEPFWAIVRSLASFADHATGRGVTASHQTIATRAGLLDDVDELDSSSEQGRRRMQAAVKRVQQVTAILTELGLYSTIRIGRPLSRREQAMFRARGLYQKAVGNEAALIVPGHRAAAAAGQPVPSKGRTFHLHRAISSKGTSPVTEIPSKPRSRRTDASRPGQGRSRGGMKSTQAPMRPLSDRSPAFRRLVAELDQAVIGKDGAVVGRFTQGRSVLGLVRILDDFGIDASYTADELLERVLRWEPHFRFRDGLGWLRHRLARAFRRPTSPAQVPPTPPEFRGHRDLEQLWATDEPFRDGWVRLQALKAVGSAPEPSGTPAIAEPAQTATSSRDVAPGVAAPHARPLAGTRSVPQWRQELDEARARMEAEGEDAWAAGLAAVRAAGSPPKSLRHREPYVPGRALSRS